MPGVVTRRLSVGRLSVQYSQAVLEIDTLGKARLSIVDSSRVLVVLQSKGVQIMNHLERLLTQYYDWKGYVVRSNIRVGRRVKGGWDGELDVVAYHHGDHHLLHIEASTDADTWAVREDRFTKKFEAGQKHIRSAVFPWLSDSDIPIEQKALLVASSKNHQIVGGGIVVNLDDFVASVKSEIEEVGIMASNAIPEKYDLLRTIQLVSCGYNRVATIQSN